MTESLRPWVWRSGEEASTYEQWLAQAAEAKHFEEAEDAVRYSRLWKWLRQAGETLTVEQILLAKSRLQLLQMKEEGEALLDLPADAHLGQFLADGAELYTSNVFRLTGLPVIATARDIARHLEKLKLQEKLGTKGTRASGPLPLEPAPDIDTIRGAVQALTKDPELRILHEFFWFWPLQGSSVDKPPQNDPALQHLANGDIEQAVRHWEKVGTHSNEGPIARHNLAILFHTAALDLERVSLQQTLSEEQQKQRDGFWNRSLDMWGTVCEEEAVWSWLSVRIRALEDARITTGYARRLRTYLPVILSSINGCLAARAAEHGRPEEADRHIRLLVRRTSDSRVLHTSLLRIAGTYRDRLRDCCKQAEDLRTADPLHGFRAAETLFSQATPLLRAVDAMTYSGSGAREAAHDHVALCAFDCITAYENKTQRYAVTIPLFQRALAVALSDSAKKKIGDDIEASKKLFETGDAWCGEGYFDLPQPVLAVLEQARTLGNTGQFDQAIPLLVELLCGHGDDSLSPEQEALVRKPLAWCLSRRSVRRVNTAMDLQNAELGIITNIRERAKNPTKGFNNSFTAAQQGSNRGLPYLECMACGATIQESYYHFSYKFNDSDVKVLVCHSCNTKANEERGQRRSTFQKAVQESALDIQLADELDNTNRQIKKNITDLKGIVSSNEVTWPSTEQFRIELGLITDADLFTWLRSEDDATRRRAVDRVAKRRAKKESILEPFLTILIELLDDRDLNVRGAASSALKELNPQWFQTSAAKKSVPALRAKAEGSGRSSRTALAALEQIDPDLAAAIVKEDRRRKLRGIAASVAVLVVGLVAFIGYTFYTASHGDLLASVQLHTWKLLGEESMFARIEKAAKSSDSASRLNAIEAWGKLDNKRVGVVPALILAQLDENKTVASAALKTLARLANPQEGTDLSEAKLAVPGLLESVKTGSPDVRAKAIALLGRIGRDGHGPAIEGLSAALSHTDKDVRVSAAEVLRDIGQPAKDAVPALIEAFRDEDWGFRVNVAKALATIGPEARASVPTLKAILEELPPRSRYRREINDAVAKMADISDLIAGLGSPDHDVRARAAHQLGKAGTNAKDAIPALIKALGDQIWDVKIQAAKALVKVRVEPRSVVPILSTMLMREARPGSTEYREIEKALKELRGQR
jgi:HEAT repeat protein